MSEAVTSLAGFQEPVQQAQTVFRALLDAMAQPARVVNLPTVDELPDAIEPASGCLIVSLRCCHENNDPVVKRDRHGNAEHQVAVHLDLSLIHI